MCNVRTLTYVCGHTIPFRLSTCRGNFTYTTRKSPTGSLPSCRSFPLLTFVSQQACGACLKASAEQELEEKIARLRLGHEEDDWTKEPAEEVVQAEAELASEIWRLEEFYPDRARFKKEVRPERGPLATRGESLLSREVRAEDVVVKYEPQTTTAVEDWDWEEGYRDLGEEIAEDDEVRVGVGLPAFGQSGFDPWNVGQLDGAGQEEQPFEEFCQVMDWGDATDWALPEEREGLGNGSGEVKASQESAIQEANDELVEELEPRCEVEPPGKIAYIPKENETDKAIEAPHSSKQESITTAKAPLTAVDESKPTHKEHEPTPLDKARRRSRGRPQTTERPPHQKAMNACEPFRACSPFWMEFAVSV